MFSAVNYLSLFNVSTLTNLSPIWVLLITGIFTNKSIKNDLLLFSNNWLYWLFINTEAISRNYKFRSHFWIT
ncbi:MAG: hypothetical protein ACE1S7_01465 [Candidatus Tisiphia sp.]